MAPPAVIAPEAESLGAELTRLEDVMTALPPPVPTVQGSTGIHAEDAAALLSHAASLLATTTAAPTATAPATPLPSTSSSTPVVSGGIGVGAAGTVEPPINGGEADSLKPSASQSEVDVDQVA